VGTITNIKNFLRTQHVHLKDPIPHTHKSTVVYHTPCAGNPHNPCSATYVGETERSMDVRMKEHHNKAKLPLSDNFASAIGQHARTTGHHFRPDDVTYLAREGNKVACGIKEAIYACALDPPFNRGGGLRHFLSHTYDHILSTTIRPPKPPPPSAPGSPNPPSTSTTPDPRAADQDPTTASYAYPSSMQLLLWLRPPRAHR
jgi:hypothetical protein